MGTIINYLTQPTTWAGIVAVVSAFGVTLSPEIAAEIGSAGAAVAGLLLVIFNERKSDE
ncbi:MAG: hypothetical protein AAGC77_06460 [Pseudomonadota bacterium]